MPDHLLPWLLSTHSLLSLLGLLVYTLMSHVLRQRRHPSAAVGWVLLLLTAPYIGIPLYLTFGSRKLPRARRPAPPAARIGAAAAAGPSSGALAVASAPPDWLAPLAASMGLPPPAPYRALRLHADGRIAADALWEVIDSARSTLDVCTFLLGHDALGDVVAARLAQRARDGVRVRLMVDGIGLLMGGRRNLRDLAAQGVRVARFVPPLRSPLKGRLNLRNHRKLAIADGAHMWCGGRNLAAEYFDLPGTSGPKGHWLDMSFDLRGPIAAQAAAIFEADWRFATEEVRVALPLHPARQLTRPVGREGLQADTAATAATVAPAAVTATATAAAAASPPGTSAVETVGARAAAPIRAAEPAGAAGAAVAVAIAPAAVAAPADLRAPGQPTAATPRRAQLVPSGPDYAEDTLHALLLTACFRAQRRIRAVTPYLVPDDSLLSALILAARRGVDIEILLPASSNHRLADMARRRAMRELVAAGARIRLAPHMVHAKAIVFDEDLVLTGSANFDARSLFLNYELMVAFDAPQDVARFAQAIDRIGADARTWWPSVADPGLPRRLAEGLVLWLAFQL